MITAMRAEIPTTLDHFAYWFEDERFEDERFEDERSIKKYKTSLSCYWASSDPHYDPHYDRIWCGNLLEEETKPESKKSSWPLIFVSATEVFSGKVTLVIWQDASDPSHSEIGEKELEKISDWVLLRFQVEAKDVTGAGWKSGLPSVPKSQAHKARWVVTYRVIRKDVEKGKTNPKFLLGLLAKNDDTSDLKWSEDTVYKIVKAGLAGLLT